MKVVKNKFTGEPGLDLAVSALGYESRAHAVLDLSVFVPPSIVLEVGTGAVVNAVRSGGFGKKHTFLSREDAEANFEPKTDDEKAKGVFLDDNSSPDWEFRACFTVKRHQGSTHLCHIFHKEFSRNPRCFTALPNLMLAPSWLAKLTDTDPTVTSVLRWASRIAYGFCPNVGDDAARHECGLCRKPAEAPTEAWMLARVKQNEKYRAKDYLASARAISKSKRWTDAIEAGRGYKHVLLKP